MDKIYPNITAPKFSKQIRFELFSWLGRHLFYNSRSKIVPKDVPFLLDLGVGENYKNGWTHVDFYRFRLKFWKKKQQRKPEVETDLRYPLNCLSDIVDGVYCGHTLEHFYPDQAYRLLNEIYRVLKPKAYLRINVPDLKRAIDFYNDKIIVSDYKYRAEAIAHLTQNHGHHSVWDEELLTVALEITGFINIRKVDFGIEGNDRRLIKEQEVRRHETLVIEAQKP